MTCTVLVRAQVFARDGLMGGLVSEKYLGVACPSTTGPEDPDLDEVCLCSWQGKARATRLHLNTGCIGKVCVCIPGTWRCACCCKQPAAQA